MTIIYDFFNNPAEGLFLEVWAEKEDGIEYLWSVPVESVSAGYAVLEKYKACGYRFKR